MQKLTIISTLLLFACSANGAGSGIGMPPDAGPMGPQGPSGSQGAQGIQGSQGDAGLTGEAGATGAQGSPGTDNHIIKVWNCDFKVDPVYMPSITACSNVLSIDFWYIMDEMSSGDIFVRAGIDTYKTPLGGFPSRSYGRANNSSEFWQSGSWGAQNGADWILADGNETLCESNGRIGNWSFIFSRANSSLSVVYTGDATSTFKTICTLN